MNCLEQSPTMNTKQIWIMAGALSFVLGACGQDINPCPDGDCGGGTNWTPVLFEPQIIPAGSLAIRVMSVQVYNQVTDEVKPVAMTNAGWSITSSNTMVLAPNNWIIPIEQAQTNTFWRWNMALTNTQAGHTYILEWSRDLVDYLPATEILTGSPNAELFGSVSRTNPISFNMFFRGQRMPNID